VEDDYGGLRRQLANVERKTRALEGLVQRAANQIDALAEADCSEEAVETAHLQAQRLRQATGAIDGAA
jgi:hypothetical protein